MHHFPAIDDVYSAIKSDPSFDWSSFPSLVIAKQFITELFDAATCAAPPNTLLEVLDSLTSCPWSVFEFIMSMVERQAQSSPAYAEKFYSVVLICALQFPPASLVVEKRFCRWIMHHMRSLAQSDKQITSRVVNNDKFVQVIGNLFAASPNASDLLECFQVLMDLATYAVLDHHIELDSFTNRDRFSVTKECCWNWLKLARRRLALTITGNPTLFPADPAWLDAITDINLRHKNELLWTARMPPPSHDDSETANIIHRFRQLSSQYMTLQFVCCYYDQKLSFGKILACELGANTASGHPARTMTEAAIAAAESARRPLRIVSETTDSPLRATGNTFEMLYQLARVENGLQPFLLQEMPQCSSYQFMSLHCDIYAVANDYEAFQRTWLCQIVLSSLDVHTNYRRAARLWTDADEASHLQQQQLLQSLPTDLLRQIQYQLAGFNFNRLYLRQQKDAASAVGHEQHELPVNVTISLLFELFDKLRAAAADEHSAKRHVGSSALTVSPAIDSANDDVDNFAGVTASGQIKFISATKVDIIEYFTHGFLMLLSNTLLHPSTVSQRREADGKITDEFLSSVLVLSQASWPRYAHMLRDVKTNTAGPSYLPVLDTITQRRKFSFPQFFTYIYELDLLEEFSQLARLDLPLRQAVPPSEQITLDILALPSTATNGVNNGNGVASTGTSNAATPMVPSQQVVLSTTGGSLRTRGKSSEEREELKAAFEMQCRSATVPEPAGVGRRNSKTLSAVEAFLINERALLQRILFDSC